MPRIKTTNRNDGVVGIIGLLLGILILAWILVYVSNEITRSPQTVKEKETVIDLAEDAKESLERGWGN